jgi:hypothetical protein
MPVIYIGNSTNAVENSGDITLVAHQAGDLIVFAATATDTSLGPAVVPGGYTTLFAIGPANAVLTVAYIKATSSSTVVPTWGNTRWLSATVYRNAGIGNSVSIRSNSQPVEYANLVFIYNNNTSLTFGAVTCASPTANINTSIPPGFVNLAYKGNSATVTSLAVNVNNSPTNGFSTALCPITPAAPWATGVVEIIYSEGVTVNLTGVSGTGTLGVATSAVNNSASPTGLTASASVGTVTATGGTSVLELVQGVQGLILIGSISINSTNSVVLLGNTITGYVGDVTIPTKLVGVVGELPNPTAAVTIWNKIITSGNV